MNDCIFCKIVSGEVPAEIIYADDYTLAFMDLHPVREGHVLVVPRAHVNLLHQLPAAASARLIQAVQKLGPIVQAAVQAEAYNVGINVGQAAGQAVFHVHAHIIPRRVGDGLEQWLGSPSTSEDQQRLVAAIRSLLDEQPV